MREVYIDGKLIDISVGDEAGYVFSSPIFRDISNILSNRTTTFKIPITANNSKILGLADNPEIITDFPYREHTFEEHRGGLLFIKGICTLLKSNNKTFELSVIWGSTINLLSLKDLKLRELESDSYVEWNSHSEYLTPEQAESGYGFIITDFGRGLDNRQYIRPSVTVNKILELIESTTGVNIEYSSVFDTLFKSLWIPLYDTNANEITWADYTTPVEARTIGWSNRSVIEMREPTSDPHNVVVGSWLVSYEDQYLHVKGNFSITDRNPIVEDGTTRNIIIQCRNSKGVYFKQEYSASSIGVWYGQIEFSTPESSEYTPYIMEVFYNDSVSTPLNNPTINHFNIDVTPRNNEVKYGEKLPLASNLPDLSVIDFLKAIMHMYGLYAYYDYTKPDVVQFISIDEIYSKYKKDAYNWTDKLIETSEGRYAVTYVYSDYKQKNWFRYAKDDTVFSDADGFVSVDNLTLGDEKEVITLPFAPSENITEGTTEEDMQSYAKIKLFDADGKKQNVKDRVLKRGRYFSDGIEYLATQYIEKLSFGGIEGLLKEYYQSFQSVLLRPVVVEFAIELDDFELHKYREVTPIYIDGVYYMMLELTATSIPSAGKMRCACKAIKMPYLNPDVLN